MLGTMAAVRNWFHDDGGVTAVEYAVLLALIIVAVAVTINAVGGTTLNIFQNDASRIDAAINGS